jgi:hypothetical protein
MVMIKINYTKPVVLFYVLSLAILLYAYATANGLALPIKWDNKKPLVASNINHKAPSSTPAPTQPSPTPTAVPSEVPMLSSKLKHKDVGLSHGCAACNDDGDGAQGGVNLELDKINAGGTLSTIVEEKVIKDKVIEEIVSPVISVIPDSSHKVLELNLPLL